MSSVHSTTDRYRRRRRLAGGTIRHWGIPKCEAWSASERNRHPSPSTRHLNRPSCQTGSGLPDLFQEWKTMFADGQHLQWTSIPITHLFDQLSNCWHVTIFHRHPNWCRVFRSRFTKFGYIRYFSTNRLLDKDRQLGLFKNL